MPEPRALERAAISGSASSTQIQRVCRACEEGLSSRTIAIQRFCPECEEELHRQTMEEEDEEVTIQAKEISGRTPKVTSSMQSQVNALRGGGQPLPESVRAFFEPRFGQDFSDVRVHTDASAARSARQLRALAYTTGRHIVFGAGQYATGTTAGRRLLAHELVHSLQQRRGEGGDRPPALQRTIGDGHDLRSPRFSGDVLLEAVFDGEALITVGARGGAVRKIQEALLDQGFELPRFGADGVFGSETANAVRAFQAHHGATTDGIVGPETMSLLDEQDPKAQTKFPGPRTRQPTEIEKTVGDFVFDNFIKPFNKCLIDPSFPPTYLVTNKSSVPVTVEGTFKVARIPMRADFEHNPSFDPKKTGLHAACCEARQHIMWPNKTDRPPHFPSTLKPLSFHEDRDPLDKRFGHRRGKHAECVADNQYVEKDDTQNCFSGPRFLARDTATVPVNSKFKEWNFRLFVVDQCKGNRLKPEDNVTVKW